MLLDVSGSKLVSNLGWVDKGALWIYDGHQISRLPIADVGHLRLFRDSLGRRLTIQHDTPEGWRISVRDWTDLEHAVCTIDVRGLTVSVAGDAEAVVDQPRVYVGYLSEQQAGTSGYYLLEISGRGCGVRRLDWFGTQFDWGYQSVLSVLEVPSGEYIFGVQRSSDLFICQRSNLSTTRAVRLHGSLGNPVPFLRSAGAEMWAVDYDTLVKLDTATLEVSGLWHGQGPTSRGGMFLGQTWMPSDEASILVARPGCGDVVEIDPAQMPIRQTWTTGREPLSAPELNGVVVARECRSGDLLTVSR